MNRTINQKETEKLFEVCKNYGVIFYDVQIEIVDHLASLIEEKWEETPELEFKQALKNAVLQFGKSNFTKMAREKEKEVGRKYNILLWKYFVEFYKWPKLLITITFTLGLFILFQLGNEVKSLIVFYFGFVLVAFLLYLIFFYPKYKIKNPSGKLLLLVSIQNQVIYYVIILVQLPNLLRIFFNSINDKVFESEISLAILSFFIVFSSVLLYANMFYLPKKIKEHFIEEFPKFVK